VTTAVVEPLDAGLIANGATPLPVTLTICEPEDALSETVRVPVRVPVAVGVNVTRMVHCAPAARLAAHRLSAAKSPFTMIEVMDSAAPPVFERVTVCAELVEPRVTSPKFKEAGDTPA
jgi:hypothetical protein